jgi:Flp pilus assembly protein TadG
VSADAHASPQRPGAWRSEDGNVLLLMPAAVLVLLILGAIAVDFSIVFQADRRASDLAASIANDSATGLDAAQFFGGAREVVLDGSLAGTLTSANDPRIDPGTTCRRRVLDAVTVEVTCTATAPLIFAPGLPGGERLGPVSGTAVARAVQR